MLTNFCQSAQSIRKQPTSQYVGVNCDQFPFSVIVHQGIKDPAKQCLDILCFDPTTWVDNKEEVCR